MSLSSDTGSIEQTDAHATRALSIVRAAQRSLTACVLLAAVTLHAQTAPPICPSPTSTPFQGVHHTTAPTPTPGELQSTLSTATTDPSFLTVAEPANFGIARYRIQNYADCTGDVGCYWADLDAQARRAEAELDRLLAEHKAATPRQAEAQKLAIVLDIDETSLSSFCEQKREDFGFIQTMWTEWALTPEAAVPIPGIVRLSSHARAAGVAVFFLTGRSHELTEATARNLRLAGFKDWQGLVLRSEEERDMPTIQYKSAERAKIVAAGYKLLISVGDQWSDLLGTPRAEISVKLPNPFYYLP